MGLMDLLSGSSGGSGGSMFQTVLGMVANHEGGVEGLLAQLKSSGLEEHVKSWIGDGQNMPVTADQIESALGAKKLAELAQSAGISKDEAAAALAKHLPDVVDKLSPNGQLPDSGMMGEALGMLKGLMGS